VVNALVVGLNAGSLNEGRNSIIEFTTDEHTQAMSEAPGAEYVPVPVRAGWWQLVRIWEPDQVANPLRRFAPPEAR
jgi:hypothetical protein